MIVDVVEQKKIEKLYGDYYKRPVKFVHEKITITPNYLPKDDDDEGGNVETDNQMNQSDGKNVQHRQSFKLPDKFVGPDQKLNFQISDDNITYRKNREKGIDPSEEERSYSITIVTDYINTNNDRPKKGDDPVITKYVRDGILGAKNK